MKFKNTETGAIIEVNSNDKERIVKFKGYPDKFESLEQSKKEQPKKEK